MNGSAPRFAVVMLSLVALLLLPGCPESDEAGVGAVGDTAADVPDTGGGPPCVPSCDWRECGIDPACGTSCGACTAGEVCDKGSCIPPGCTPDCSQVACGRDPVCGAYCGECGAGLTCDAGACVEGTCAPRCGRRECGPDPVCVTSCGVCATGSHCEDGTCVAGPCQPNCGELECGADPRCGASCGTCGVGEACEAGRCVPDQPCTCDPPCAAGYACDGESCACVPTGETCTPPCAAGETCVDGACVCVPQCDGRECGPDPVCGVACGACEAGCVCDESGRCAGCGCEAQCDGRECGPDPACGESCGTCPAGCACGSQGQCVCGVEGACANDHDLPILNELDAAELVTECVLSLECPLPECYAGCIQEKTDVSEPCAGCYGELAACGLRSCAQRCVADQGGADCLACLEASCMAAFERCAGIELLPCEAQCGDRECGPDPACGASCGSCPAGEHCENGVCGTGPCEPDCRGLACGLDPVCGLSCGLCQPGLHCDAGRCVEGPCEPDCRDRQCGPDPVCGRPCGACPVNEHCENGTCAAGPCEPRCGDRECGPDPVCGAPCGFCDAGARCVQGVCEPLVPPEDACVNPRDLEILNSDLDAVAIAQQCLLAGTCGFDDAQCLGRCVADLSGLSPACSRCFGGLAVCGLANCLTECVGDPGGPSCFTCLDEACMPDFEPCSGVTITGCEPQCGDRECGLDPVCGESCGACAAGERCAEGVCEPIGPPPADACNNAQDLAILNEVDAQAVAETCLFGANCGTDEACLGACVREQTGISRACSACYGALAVCGLNFCLMDCFNDPAGAACLACIDDACMPGFEACSGVTWQEVACTPSCDGVACGGDGCGGSCGTCDTGFLCTQGRCEPFGEGVCADPENEAILARLDFQGVAFACLPGCVSDIPCLTDCVETESGLSSGCAFCLAVTAACALDNCLNACLTDPTGAACGTCVVDSCGADFEGCAGVELPPIAF